MAAMGGGADCPRQRLLLAFVYLDGSATCPTRPPVETRVKRNTVFRDGRALEVISFKLAPPGASFVKHGFDGSADRSHLR